MIFLHRVLQEGVVNQIRPSTTQAWKPYDFSIWAQHKLRREAVVTLSAKQKRGKLANVIPIHQVQPRLISFQQNCWTVWLRLDDFCTKEITHRSSSHTDLKQQRSLWAYNRCALWKQPLPEGWVKAQTSPAWATCDERNWQINFQTLTQPCQIGCSQGCETERSNIQLSMII